MQTMKQAAAEFLAGTRVAVTGVSRKPRGQHTVLLALSLSVQRSLVLSPAEEHV